MRFRALALALCGAGCGGQDGQTKDVPPVTTAPTSTAPTASASAIATGTATASAMPATSASAAVVVASASAAPSGSGEAGPETLLGTVKIKSIQAIWAANSDKVGDRMILGFRRCYSNALKDDPNAAAGDVRIQANIGANGEVISTKILKPSKLPASVETCMATRVSTALFAPPPAAPGFLKVTIHCDPH